MSVGYFEFVKIFAQVVIPRLDRGIQ